MKKKHTFWKALGIAALAAAVPVRAERDLATGKKKYQSLLLSVDVTPDESGRNAEIGINIGEGLLTEAAARLFGGKKETSLFADDDPQAAVVEPIPFVRAEEPASAEEEPAPEEPAPEVEATEEDFDPDL